MRQQLALLIPTALVGGCSLIYNPSNISKPPADALDPDALMTADADIDAPPLADADPGMVTLLDVMPKVLFEGQGKFGSRPALVVIRGHHFIADGLSVDISPNTGLTVSSPTVSMNGDFIAMTVSIDIDANVDTGTTPLTITVMQNGAPVGGVSLMNKLSVQYLPQFPSGTSIATSSLAPLYSDVNTGNVTFTGAQRAVVRSVSRIKMGNISANGGAGTTNAAGAAGPGACAGGPPAANAPCLQSDGGGVGAGGSAGGGGGGFAVAGNTGVGAGGGAGGGAHGSSELVSYGANQGAGGGGGGKGSLSNSGGGGGGGGTVELAAGGDIEVGTIDVKGGNGGAGSSVLNLGASGGGGGGSGGVAVLRSEAGTITAGAITATGGAGGAAGGAGAGGGGAGAPGRVRVDVATGAVPASSPDPHRGPAFVNAPTIVTTKHVMFSMTGTTGNVVDAYVIPDDGMVHTGEPMDMMFSSGALAFQGVLLPGYNKFCVTLEPGTRGHADQLADKCVELAYLP